MMTNEKLCKGEFLPKEFIKDIQYPDKMIHTQKGRTHLYYYNIPASYDIETSSFRDERGFPVAITYSHAINIDGYCFKVETWEELVGMLNTVSDYAGLDDKHRLVIYVHNLSYEFQFMKRHFNFKEVFSNGGERDILYALTNNGIEFRCSYMLSGSSLAVVARNLVKYKIEKLNGDLDHTQVRTPLTPITKEEEGYILNDILIIEYYIREAIDEAGDITKLPLTQTGYVREYIRNNTIMREDKESDEYRELMRQLTLEKTEYQMLRNAFGGGFTHANIEHVKKIINIVRAFDFASSYPARMIQYQFPMGKGERYNVKNKKDFYEQLKSHCCLFYVKFKGLNQKANEGYISGSKAIKHKNMVLNNGRVYAAEELTMYITDVDFRLIAKSYDIDDFEVGTLYRYKRGYLPTSFIKSILKMYADKTQLKGVEDKIVEYNRSKSMLNSSFGMIVMDIIQDAFEWDDVHKESVKLEQDIDKLIRKHNRSRKRFLYYPWGVWITAYARYDLFSTIVELEDDYIYSDTDSIYVQNPENNAHIFEASNKRIKTLLEKAMKYHNLDPELLQPKDPKGRPRPIGLWDLDGDYDRFKTLGAKRYMVESKGKVNITVSGVNKSVAVPYLKETFGDKIFEKFDEGLFVPEGHAGKMTHTYIDEPQEGVVRDYRGQEYYYKELSGVHLEETYYTLSISDEFNEMIEYIRQGSLTSKVKTG